MAGLATGSLKSGYYMRTKPFVRVWFQRFGEAAAFKEPSSVVAARCLRNQPLMSNGPFMILKSSDAKVRQLVDVEGWEPVQAAMKSETGALIVSFHFGVQGLITAYAARSGFAPHVLRGIQFAGLAGRTGADLYLYGGTPIYVGHNTDLAMPALNSVRHVWKRGGLVLATPDARSGASFRRVQLFGMPFQIRTALAELAWRMKVPIFPGSATFADGRFRIAIGPQLDLGGDTPARFAAEMVAFMERTIGQHPDNMNFYLLRRLYGDQRELREE
jgi:lauroyl/myristoyl acyltransferase